MSEQDAVLDAWEKQRQFVRAMVKGLVQNHPHQEEQTTPCLDEAEEFLRAAPPGNASEWAQRNFALGSVMRSFGSTQESLERIGATVRTDFKTRRISEHPATEPFLVSPSEAVLIGMCLEEYLQAWDDDKKNASILAFIDTRLRPLTPEMTRYGTTEIPEDDLPPDVIWPAETLLGYSFDTTFGYSFATKRVFSRSGESIVEHTAVDESRKSLADLLCDMVDSFAGKSHLEEAVPLRSKRNVHDALMHSLLRNLRDVVESAQRKPDGIEDGGLLLGDDAESNMIAIDDRLSDLARSLQELSGELAESSERRDADDAKAIERAVQRLISHNKVTEEFVTGRLLGALLAHCHRDACLWVVHQDVGVASIGWQCPFPDELFMGYEGCLGQLRDIPLVRAMHYAPLVIDNELARVAIDRVRIFDTNSRAGTDRIAQIRVLAGVIVGELIASLRDADVAAFQKDATSATPRMFPIGREATRDHVRGQVALIEREFNERTAIGVLPESIVVMLSNAIEAIVKRVWPAEFARGGGREDFGRTLDEKAARASNDLERRFARIAQSFYKNYRNPSIHDPRFQCSYEEARLFVNVIRALDDLGGRVRRIREDGTSSSSSIGPDSLRWCRTQERLPSSNRCP